MSENDTTMTAASVAAAEKLAEAVAALKAPLPNGILIYIAVLVGCYLMFLLSVSVWSYKQNKGKDVNVDDHFTGGGTLGPIVLTCTLFATVFSGYTAVGIPNEAYTKGFLANRWPCVISLVVLISVTISSRLREVAVERKYNSPVSLIEDRFNSKILHRAISIIMAVPMVFYLTAQFAALGSTIVSLSQGAVPAVAGQIVLAVVMLLYETFGGLKGVAITDVLQGCLLLLGTLCTCGLLAITYGPFPQVWQRIISTNRLNWNLVPTFAEKVDVFSFMASQLAYPIYPHVLQRVVAAESTNVLKLSWATLPIVCYMAQIPGMFLGIYGADPEFLPFPVEPSGYFGEAMNVFLHGNGASIFVAGIMLVGSLAAIMSTADSAIISCSNIVTIDLVKGWLWPMCNGGVEPNARQTMLVSKVASLIIVILGVLITNLDIDLSSLFVLQGALLGQAVPAYLLALYHPTIMDKSLEIGMLTGIVVFAILEFSGPELKKAVLIGPGFIGLICNCVVLFAVQFALTAMGKTAQPDADKLVNSEIERIMENNVREPTKNPVLLLAWILVWFLPPWVFPSDTVNGIILGCPAWFIYQICLHGFVTGLLMYVIHSWKPAPPNKRKVGPSGMTESDGLKTAGIELAM
jgi:SSS family solute:Na+ symporter/sodium/pantothenate symporter